MKSYQRLIWGILTENTPLAPPAPFDDDDGVEQPPEPQEIWDNRMAHVGEILHQVSAGAGLVPVYPGEDAIGFCFAANNGWGIHLGVAEMPVDYTISGDYVCSHWARLVPGEVKAKLSSAWALLSMRCKQELNLPLGDLMNQPRWLWLSRPDTLKEPNEPR